MVALQRGGRRLKNRTVDSTPSHIVTAEDRAAMRRAGIRPTLGRRFKWRVEAIAHGAFEFLLGSLPLAWGVTVGRGLGAVATGLMKKRRRTVERNLRIAFAGELDRGRISEMTGEVFRRAGANLLASLRTARLDEAGLATAVEVRDETLFRDAVARGKGVVLVLAHMGNWEALAQWFPRLLPPGVDGATVYRPLNNPVLNARVVAQRKRRGIGLFSKDDNPLGMASFLRRGGVLGVLSDQRAGKIGELAPFFGRVASCSPIPAILARRTGAAVLGVSLRTLQRGRWELRFHELGEEPTTAAVMRLVERMMRVSPADVFWLQDRWRPGRLEPHRIEGKAARGDIVTPTRRRRALVCSGRPPRAEPDDVDHEFAAPAAGEGAGVFLRRLDDGAVLPIDYVVGGGAAIRQACREAGIAWTEGEIA